VSRPSLEVADIFRGHGAAWRRTRLFDARDWAFNYYSRNAQYSLQHLARTWDDVAPAFVNETRSPSQRWDYCQDLLDKAIKGFGSTLAKDVARREEHAARRARATDKKRKRRIVRELTLAERRRSGEAIN
jgi:hypothetical protein